MNRRDLLKAACAALGLAVLPAPPKEEELWAAEVPPNILDDFDKAWDIIQETGMPRSPFLVVSPARAVWLLEYLELDINDPAQREEMRKLTGVEIYQYNLG